MYQLIKGGIVDDMIVAMFVSITRYIFFKEQGTVGVQLFCIWLSLMTLSVSDHKPYVYIYSSLAQP